MKKRLGGTVYLETACLVAIMKWDGEKDETIEANYLNRDTSHHPGLVQRVLAYLKHDMVAIFLNDYWSFIIIFYAWHYYRIDF